MSTQIITTDDGQASEQGEQERAKLEILWATPAETEAFVQDARAKNPYKIKCRRKGRHDYEDDGTLTFVGITSDGLWVRRLPCHRCHAPEAPVAVEQVQLWEVRHYRKEITSATIVTAYPDYLDEDYLNSGVGRMKPRAIVSAEATLVLRGRNYRDERKQVILNVVSAHEEAEVTADEVTAERHDEAATA